jgi:hypothetical protein
MVNLKTHYPLLLSLLGSPLLVVVSVVDSFATSKNYLSTSKSQRAAGVVSTTSIKMSSNNIELPSQKTLDLLLSVAINASKQAGEIILGNAGGADVLKSKANSRDLLTLIDPLCEKVSFLSPQYNTYSRLPLFRRFANHELFTLCDIFSSLYVDN